MIKTEELKVGDRILVKTYSDEGKYIIQNETGQKYAEAVDIPGLHTYIESNELIENNDEKSNEE